MQRRGGRCFICACRGNSAWCQEQVVGARPSDAAFTHSQRLNRTHTSVTVCIANRWLNFIAQQLPVALIIASHPNHSWCSAMAHSLLTCIDQQQHNTYAPACGPNCHVPITAGARPCRTAAVTATVH